MIVSLLIGLAFFVMWGFFRREAARLRKQGVPVTARVIPPESPARGGGRSYVVEYHIGGQRRVQTVRLGETDTLPAEGAGVQYTYDPKHQRLLAESEMKQYKTKLHWIFPGVGLVLCGIYAVYLYCRVTGTELELSEETILTLMYALPLVFFVIGAAMTIRAASDKRNVAREAEGTLADWSVYQSGVVDADRHTNPRSYQPIYEYRDSDGALKRHKSFIGGIRKKPPGEKVTLYILRGGRAVEARENRNTLIFGLVYMASGLLFLAFLLWFVWLVNNGVIS